ncbi:MAG: B-box zinc finger protein, partial [Acidobacteriaceae bacterium]
MNCANHPETPATAYCQFCGKPLCTQCVHKINNFVGCAPCLEARLHAATAGGYGASSSPVLLNTGQPQPWGTEPWIALLLGFIPGVGAMYNGQFAKGIAHVIIFVMLIDLTHYNGLIGMIIAAWIIYQVFDAYQTALARRNGLPLPNPLGLNNIGQWFGVRMHNPYPSTNHTAPEPTVPASSPDIAEPPPASAFASGYPPP